MKRILVLLVILAAAASQPLLAASDTKFKIFGAVAWVSPLDDGEVSINNVESTLEGTDALGWNIGFEFRISDRLGIEADYINSTQDFDFDGETVGEFRIEPVSATLNIHLFDSDVVDLYLGPTASWVFFNDVEFENVTGEVDVDEEFAWGASLGLDIGIGDHVAIVAGLRWLNLEVDSDDPTVELDALGIDPLIARAGLGFRF